MLKYVTKIPNGNILVNFSVFECDKCKNELPENFPRFENEEGHFCGNCAFIKGFISEKELKRNFYFFIHEKFLGIPIIENDNVVWVSKKYFNAKKANDYRRTPEYIHWRKSVFERDNYTCKKCNKVGGILNAHHIKKFKDYPKLRLEISNGITLCVECHRKAHTRKCEVENE